MDCNGTVPADLDCNRQLADWTTFRDGLRGIEPRFLSHAIYSDSPNRNCAGAAFVGNPNRSFGA